MKIEAIEVGNWQGKSMRAERLVRRHELAGLKFREISELPIFSDRQCPSMSCLYLNFKKKSNGAK